MRRKIIIVGAFGQENSPQYFPFFPGDIPVTMRQLEYGFRKSVFGANTGQVIKPY